MCSEGYCTWLNTRPHGGAAVRGPTHQLSVGVLHVVCRVLSAPFMHCVHHYSAEGFALQCCSLCCASDLYLIQLHVSIHVPCQDNNGQTKRYVWSKVSGFLDGMHVVDSSLMCMLFWNIICRHLLLLVLCCLETNHTLNILEPFLNPILKCDKILLLKVSFEHDIL